MIRRNESAAQLLKLPKWLEPCGQIVNGLKCPQNHHVLSYRNSKTVLCDLCRQLIKTGRRIRGCRVCDWDVCAKCASGMMTSTSKGRSRTSPTRSPLLSGQPGGPVDALPFTNTTLEHQLHSKSGSSDQTTMTHTHAFLYPTRTHKKRRNFISNIIFISIKKCLS